jgi:hypothetical protein
VDGPGGADHVGLVVAMASGQQIELPGLDGVHGASFGHLDQHGDA